jgi:superfamily I DNA/RNA helicase
MQIARLVGGAGTGKTTELLKIMESALQVVKDPTLLGFASFTRAARAEAVSRASSAWNIDPEILSKKGWFRTVHSTVLRCLGDSASELIGDSKEDLEWISKSLGVKLSTDLDDQYGRQKYIGDPVVSASLNCWSLARVTMTSLEEVVRRARAIDDNVPEYAKVVSVAERYEMAKRLDDRMDFDDSLMRFSGVRMSPTYGISMITPMGFLPEVQAWLFDEQQDASPLLDIVCKRLVSSPTVKWCYVVGDPFQSIYGFAGSSSSCFMAWKADKERIMPKSWRCPKQVLDLGERCLRRLSKGYFDRGIAPADHDGSVSESTIEDAAMMAKPDEDWLFIARTNFQATRLAAALHSFSRPMRWVNQPDGLSGRAVGLRGLYALEKGETITGIQWKQAIELLPVKDKDGATFLKRGVKAQWRKDEELPSRWDRIWIDELHEVGATDALISAIKDARWGGLVDRGNEWRRMAAKWGPELASLPRIRVGTIHSVKGAEAENVALLTTTSKLVERGLEEPSQRDEEHRIAYVGVTRARRNLIVINEGRSGTSRMEVL